jgi:hypothetical protein
MLFESTEVEDESSEVTMAATCKFLVNQCFSSIKLFQSEKLLSLIHFPDAPALAEIFLHFFMREDCLVHEKHVVFIDVVFLNVDHGW